MVGAPTTKVGVAAAVLHGIGAPVNNQTVGAMVGWFNAEGGNWGNTAAYNPLNTTLKTPGSRSINGVGVQAYGNWNEGINSTVQTLRQPNMSGIVDAFRSGNPQNVVHAIGSSPWGTSASLVAKTIGDATGQRYSIPSSIGAQMAQRNLASPTPGVTTTGPTQTTNYDQALLGELLSSNVTASASGKVSVPNILGNAINNATTTTTNPTTTINPSSAASGISLRSGNLPASGKGDLNPLGAGWTLGRTDMGVDANAVPGTPIHALNDSKVVQIEPNWYKGQPLVMMQIISGPNTGKYWYVAEQIDQNLRVGQVIPKGHTVATYAQNGTGIEIGWGAPGGRTQAQATTGYTEGQQTVAGQSFRSSELH